jgi:lipopolysaccharide/colanic/teichoic acid biosynthesis glycosyltransferase
MRRLADLAIACVLLVITLPLMLIVALAIKSESRDPVLETQTCMSFGGRRFQMLRFRTATHHTERATPPWARQLTRVGQVLRYTRIDALPQLINVLRGEMSVLDSDAHASSFLD